MFLEIVLLVVGFIFLIKGADWLVDGSSALAKKYKISDLAIGLTIVAFGTSAPELVVNVFANLDGHEGIIFGNIIGSNNFNLFFILGIAGLISPLIVQSSTVWKEIPLSLLAVVILYFLTNEILSDGPAVLSRIDGVILLILFLGFLYYVYRQFKSDPVQQKIETKSFTTGKIWLFIIIGLSGLVIGGNLVVTNAISMATAMGVSETIIGLTIVAAGTSLPELATSVVAAVKKNNDIAVGNVIGSNIFNIFFILGVTSLVRPVSFDMVFNDDMFLLSIGTTFLFLCMFVGKKHILKRWQAAVLLFTFVGYTIYLVGRELQ
jgi:cation:H+ antiporter